MARRENETMKMRILCGTILAAAIAFQAVAGMVCADVSVADFSRLESESRRIDALDATLWDESEWICAADASAPEGDSPNGARSAGGTSWFVGEIVNKGKVKSAKWMTTGLGVYELYVNGMPVGSGDALKPGFTHVSKTRRSFTYDITERVRQERGEKNFFAAEVSTGWWSDKIVKYAGKKSAFRAVLAVAYEDGSVGGIVVKYARQSEKGKRP